MKGVHWFFTALSFVIIGLLVAVIVLVTVDFEEDDHDNSFPHLSPTIRLNDGREFPVIGLGTVGMSSDQARLSTLDAIDRGYRHIDTAYIYNTEIGVGQGVNAKMTEGVIMREDIFIVSKLWNTFHDPQVVRGAVENSLSQLNLAYVDLYLIHWPMSYSENTDFDLIDTWRALEALVDEGLIKSIGVSNFNTSQIDYILDNARIKPVVNQIEVHPHCLNKRLIAHCRSRDIAVTAYSPLGSPGNEKFTSDSRLAINEPEIRAVAQRHQRTPAQIMIRYQIQIGNIPIPKSSTRDRIITNFDVFNFSLSDEDIRLIESIPYNFRIIDMEDYMGHREYPFETFECL